MKKENGIIKIYNRQMDKDLLRIILVVLVVILHGTYYDITTKYGGINYGYLMAQSMVADTIFHKSVSCLSEFIYTFHIPVFISLSGSLFAFIKDKGIKSLIRKRLRDF